MSRKLILSSLVLAAFLQPATQFAQKAPGPRPPVEKDDDMATIREPGKTHDAMYYDFLDNTFAQAPRNYFRRLSRREPAWNVNAWDEVPDSSWFTNRNRLHPLTPEQIYRGAAEQPGPDLSAPLVVLEGKTAGISLGFGRTRDARGNIYFIKFDPSDCAEMSTAAEVIGSRLFYAMGFNVPAESIVYLRADQIAVDPAARIWDKTGRQRKMSQADVERVLAGAARMPDGRYRAVTSLLIQGKIKGPFKFYGTREDDPNDLIPHEYRRELRGLRLLSAWLSHFDIRAGNTLDTYVEEGGRKFLRHYLLDFGATLGSASRYPKSPRVGFAYAFDPVEMAGPLFTLGLYQPVWRKHPSEIKYTSIGRFESSYFSAADWKPLYPIASFDFMDGADAVWAAKIVMSFTEGQIRAAVHAGQLSDPEAEDYLVRTLIERQRKIGRFAFSRVNPLDQFNISGAGESARLEFQDLAARYGFAEPPAARYCYALSRLGEQGGSDPTDCASKTAVPLGGLLQWAHRTGSFGSLFVLTMHTRRAESGFADKSLKVYLEMKDSGFEVKGWEREA